jgi:hypothetical protein
MYFESFQSRIRVLGVGAPANAALVLYGSLKHVGRPE